MASTTNSWSAGLSFRIFGGGSGGRGSVNPNASSSWRGSITETEKTCCFDRCTGTPSSYIPVTCYSFRKRKDSFICCLATFSILSFLVAAILPPVIIKLLNDGINSQVIIDSTSAPSYQAWQTNIEGPGASTEVHYDLYFFDIQNPDDVLTGAKPILLERGPYAYREYYNKFDISWSDGSDSVTYNTQRYYVFDPSRSAPGLSENDTLLLAYPTVLALEYLLAEIPVSVTTLVNSKIESSITKTFNKIEAELSNIYNQIDAAPLPPKKKSALEAEVLKADATLHDMYTKLMSFVEQSTPITLLLKLLLCNSPYGITPFFKSKPGPAYFGWLNDPLLLQVQEILDSLNLPQPVPWTSAVPGASTNWTSVEDRRRRRAPSTFKTGKNDVSQVGSVVNWEGKSDIYCCIAPMNSQNTSEYVEGEEFPSCAFFQNSWTQEEAKAAGYALAWGDAQANSVTGSNGEMFGRPLTSQRVPIFVEDVFRGFNFEVQGDVDWFGVTLKRTHIPDVDLQNATLNPSNAAYHSFGPLGLLNLTIATNSPSYASYPHFYKADKRLVEAVEGLSPSSDLHSTYLDIEPLTGLLARAKKSLQSNFKVTSMHFPVSTEDYTVMLHEICYNISAIIAESGGLGLNITIPAGFSCSNLTLADATLECLARPADWNVGGGASSWTNLARDSSVAGEASEGLKEDGLGNGELYLPQAWVSESFSLSEEDANSFQEQIYATEEMAQQIFLWGMILGCSFLFCALCVLLTYYMDKNFSSSNNNNDSDNDKSTLQSKSAAADMKAEGLERGGEDVIQPLLSAALNH